MMDIRSTELTINEKMLSKNIVLTESMENLNKLSNIMGSLSKLSASFGAFYTLAFSHLSNITTLENNEINQNLRKQLVLTHTSYFKSLMSEDSSIDMNSLLNYDESRIFLEEVNDYYSVMTCAGDLLNAYIKMNYDIGGMIKDGDISKWKKRYFKDIENDIIRIFNEIDAYRLAMSTIYLMDSIEISDLNVKINTCSDIVEYIKTSFSEIDLFFKECSTVYYQICQNAIDLSNPIPISNVSVTTNDNIPPMIFGNNGFETTDNGLDSNDDLPDDF